MLLVAALAGSVLGCSKADSAANKGSTPPVNEPATARTGATVAPTDPEGAAPADNGAQSGPDDSFQIENVAGASATGGEAVARIVVRPGKGYHMNKDYPTKLTLQLPAGVSSPKPVLVPADAEAFTETQLAFAVKLTAGTAGDYTIPATLKFAVCTDSTCDPKKRSIELQLKAQ